jgi:hypothetical protein
MIDRRMANIIKRFARHRDDMRLANFQRVRSLDAEWKLLRCPTEYCLPNLTPLWANRNLGSAHAVEKSREEDGLFALAYTRRRKRTRVGHNRSADQRTERYGGWLKFFHLLNV